MLIMRQWQKIIGQSFSPATFADYCNTIHWTTWRPSFIVLHNTAVPTLAQRPNGLSHQNILDLEVYYRDNQHWSAGPHLFVDDRQIWVFTPLTVHGVHSPSWNNVALGIEMLGDYAKEDFNSGRGLAVQQNAISAIATLTSVLGLDPNSMKLHKEDPLTTHICPGANVNKASVIAAVIDQLATLHPGEHFAGTE